MTASQTVEYLNVFQAPFPLAHDTEPALAPDHHIATDGTRYELGSPIPLDDKLRLQQHLGRPVLVQAIDRDGRPLQRIPQTELFDPDISGMDPEDVIEFMLKEITRRMELAKKLPEEPVPPIIGRLALGSNEPHNPIVQTTEVTTLILVPGSHRLQPVLNQSSAIATAPARLISQPYETQERP